MKKKVLYIEDEPYLARIVKDTLELRGYEVLHKTDGNKIMEFVSSYAPDICLLDVMMPNMDGFTLAEEIRNVDPDIPLFFLSIHIYI